MVKETMTEAPKMFDAHCHLQDVAFDADRQQMLEESLAAGVSHFLVPATDIASFESTLELASSHDNIFCALGIHPHSANEWNAEVREQIQRAFQSNDKIVAIGEIGLDYHYDFSPREVQRKAFAEQIELAIELNKPIVIHTRESEEDVFRIVEEHYGSLPEEIPRGQFHCFSAGLDWMHRAISLGFHVSFTGNITFKNSNLAEVVRETPLDKILIETDSPYLTPAPHRGKRNSPAMLPFIARKVSELKQLDISIIMNQTFANTLSLFRIPASIVGNARIVGDAWSIQKTIGLLLLAFGLLSGASNLHAQQPAGIAPPDSVLTGERRKAAELRKKQEEELAKEAESRRQDSIKTAQKDQQEAMEKAREQVREDSIRVAEQMNEESRHAAFLLTPQPWRTIGFGGNLGIGTIHAGVDKQQLTPTSVLAYGLQLKSEVTRRLDVSAAFTHYEISDNFPQDSVFTYGTTPAKFPYNPAKDFSHTSETRLVRSESLGISILGIDLDYVITKPSSIIKFYFGIGYQHYMMKGLQNYLKMIDSVTASPNQQTFEQDWSRNGIELMFGLKSELELGNGLTLEPFMEISTTGIFNGPTQFPNFVFQPDQTDLITVNLKAGFTLYYGWWGVPRE
jgi:TatD DNase family protein